MTTIGIIGAGEVGCQIARATLASGYQVVIANSRGSETLAGLIAELGPAARAASAADAAATGDFAVVAVPLKVVNDMPIDELAGKIVLDTNNYMVWRDGRIPVVDSGEKTIHELRQEQLPTSNVAKAFTHIQAPRLLPAARPPGAPAAWPCRCRATSPKPSSSGHSCTTSSASTLWTTARSANRGAPNQGSPPGCGTRGRTATSWPAT